MLEVPTLVYLVHGWYLRFKDDTNGLAGAWWVPLRQLVKQLGKDLVLVKLAEFREQLLAKNTAAIQSCSGE